MAESARIVAFKKRRSIELPPQISELSPLRILLLGKSASESSRVGNSILGRSALDSEAPPDVVERVGGRVKDRHVTLINSPHLLNPDISEHQITQTLRECVSLSDPGPHVFILTLQCRDFTEEDMRRGKYVLNKFSEDALRRTIIITTDQERVNEFIQELTVECGGGRLQLEKTKLEWPSEIINRVDEMLKENQEQYLTCEIIHDVKALSVSEDDGNAKERMQEESDQAVVARSPSPRNRQSRDIPPDNFSCPPVSEVRILLLGKSASESSRVGNSILGRSALDSEAPPDVVERVGGRVKDRHVTLINSPHLLNPDISEHQITQTLRECVSLSDPGPHVFILTLQYRDFTEEDRNRVTSVLKEFSEEALRRTIIITTDEETHRSRFSSVIRNNAVRQLIKDCGRGCLQLEETKPEWSAKVFKRVDEILKDNQEQFLTGEIAHDVKVKESSVHEEQSRSEKEKKSSHYKDDGKERQRQKEKSDHVSAISSKNQKLNLVLCGSDTALTVSVSKLLRGKRIKSSHQRAVGEVCVKKEEKMDGRQLSVVELPVLSGLSEEEVMRQTLLSVTLCHPGVHAFIIIVPVHLLNNDEKSEIQKILKIFDSREHCILLFTSYVTVDTRVTEFVKHSSESQSLISRCRGQYRLMGLKEPENSRQIPDLLDCIENMKTEPYSPQMYVKAQENRVIRETEKKYEEELKRMENKIKELQQKIQLEGAEDQPDDLKSLRIVLIGKTGNGKSATGNTILGREEFVSEASIDSVTTVCVKRVGEVDGQSVAVVDTPGLFDTKLSRDQAVEEIMKCVALLSPGPHVFVIVLSVGRFTNEEADTVDLIKKIFGPKAAQFSIVLFTRGDDLGNKTIQDYVDISNSEQPKKLIRDCGDRFLVFNNKDKQDRTQVIQLIKMIEEVKNTNQGRFFTNSMFEEAEMNIKKRMEEIMKEREREIEAQQEKLRVKYKSERAELKKRLEEEKRKADEERQQREKEFRQKEEKMIKDFDEKCKTEQQKQEMEKQILVEEEKQKKEAYHQKIEEMKREIENQILEFEKQQRGREEEDRKREEKYRQDQEKMKNELQMFQMKQEEEMKKRESEENRRIKEEVEERQRWDQKIKEAETERKDIQEVIKRQQREWEDDKKRQMREREEEEKKRKEKHKEQLREKQEELEKMRKRFEREREGERQKMEEERQKQRREREEKEREYEEKKQEMKRRYEQLERERKKEWERRKQEDDARREKEKCQCLKMIKDLKQEQEEKKKRREREEKERTEREEKEQGILRQKHKEEIKYTKKKHDDEARKQAEEFNDFKERNQQQIQDIQQLLDENQHQYELLEKVYQFWKDEKREELKNIKEEIRGLKNKQCIVM